MDKRKLEDEKGVDGNYSKYTRIITKVEAVAETKCERRIECSQCNRFLSSKHLLDLHLSEIHDSYFAVQATRKPWYQCLLSDCKILSLNPSSRKKHLVKDHLWKPDANFNEILGFNHAVDKKARRRRQKKEGKPTDSQPENINPQVLESNTNSDSIMAVDQVNDLADILRATSLLPRNLQFKHALKKKPACFNQVLKQYHQTTSQTTLKVVNVLKKQT